MLYTGGKRSIRNFSYITARTSYNLMWWWWWWWCPTFTRPTCLVGFV